MNAPLTARPTRSLSRDQIATSLLVGITISVLATIAFLVYSYRTEQAGARERLAEVGHSLVPSLVRALWAIDEAQVDTLLEGVMRLQGVEYVELSAPGERLRSRGDPAAAAMVERRYELVHVDGERYPLGHLRVVVGRHDTLRRLRQRAIGIAAITGLSLLGACAWFQVSFRRRVARHLRAMAEYTRDIGYDHAGPPLRLARPVADHADELDEVTAALNRMRERLLESAHARARHEAELLEHRALLEEKVAARTAQLALITDNMPALISRIDAEHRFTFNNKRYEQWLGRPLSSITGAHLRDVHGPEIYGQLAPHIDRAFAGEFSHVEVASGARHVTVAFVPQRAPNGTVTAVYGLAHDITRLKEVESELRTLAQFDPLTGLSNRRHFSDVLDTAIARSERGGAPLALLFLDLDHFKQINDRHGHEAGDMVLQAFAQRLLASVRRTDTVARLAGDEFVVLLEPVRDENEAVGVAGKILAAMAPPVRIGEGEIALGTSIGIALRRPGGGPGEAELLMRRADAALYAAKATQRGSYHVAS